MNRDVYDNPRYGERQMAADYEAMVAAVREQRPDAYVEGSAGFGWSIMSKTERGRFIGGAWWSGKRHNRYYFRILREGTLDI